MLQHKALRCQIEMDNTVRIVNMFFNMYDKIFELVTATPCNNLR